MKPMNPRREKKSDGWTKTLLTNVPKIRRKKDGNPGTKKKG